MSVQPIDPIRADDLVQAGAYMPHSINKVLGAVAKAQGADVAAEMAKLEPVTAQMVDLSLSAKAGEFGSPASIMVSSALYLRGWPWRRHGRVRRDEDGEPTDLSNAGIDWLGLVKDCVAGALGVRADSLDDLVGYTSDWTVGPEPDDAAAMFRRWGMTEIPVAEAWPGDVVLFKMPGAHAGVLVADGKKPEDRRMVHAPWARACVESYLGDNWKARLDGRAFTLRPAAQAVAA